MLDFKLTEILQNNKFSIYLKLKKNKYEVCMLQQNEKNKNKFTI